jgi:hypothetical protein
VLMGVQAAAYQKAPRLISSTQRAEVN